MSIGPIKKNMTVPRLRVFVSSSMRELLEERAVIKEALCSLNVDAWVFEADAGARPYTIQETYYTEIEAADLYIAVFWKNYGEYTIDEYQHALWLGRDCLLYEKRVDIADKRDPQLEDFLSSVGSVETGHTIRWFLTLDELGRFVKEDVARWQTEKIRNQKMSDTHGKHKYKRSVVQRYLQTVEDCFAKYGSYDLVNLSFQAGKHRSTSLTEPAEVTELRAFLESKKQVSGDEGGTTTLDTLLLSKEAQPHFALDQSEGFSPDAQGRVITLEDYLSQQIRVVLLAPPGAGKSTILRQLIRTFGSYWKDQPSTAEHEETELPKGLEGLIPIFVSLGWWTDAAMSLLEFLKVQTHERYRSPELAALLPSLIKNGEVVLLLDALNELPGIKVSEETGNVDDPRIDSIVNITDQLESLTVKCVLSCRVNDFHGKPRWHDLHVLPLNRQQVGAFAKAYYSGQPNSDVLVKGLISALYESSRVAHQGLLNFITRPFYLVKLLYYYQVKQRLPDNPTYLLEWNAVKSFEREVDAGRLSEKQVEDLQLMLGRLAFNMTESGRIIGVDIALGTSWLFHLRERLPDKSTLEGVEEPTNVVDYTAIITKGLESKLETWLGKLITGGTLGDAAILHMMYSQEEYLEPRSDSEEIVKAKKIWKQAEGTGLIIRTGDEIQFYHQLVQEYFCLSFCRSQQFDEKFLSRLASSRFTEVLSLWADIDNELLDRLIPFLKNYSDRGIRLSALLIISISGNERSILPIAEVVKDEDSQIRQAAIYALGMLRAKNDVAIDLMIEALQSDKDVSVRRQAALSLRRTVKRLKIVDERVLLALAKASYSDKDIWVKYNANINRVVADLPESFTGGQFLHLLGKMIWGVVRDKSKHSK